MRGYFESRHAVLRAAARGHLLLCDDGVRFAGVPVQADRALALFDDMRTNGHKPDTFAFQCAISCTRHATRPLEHEKTT